MTKRKQANSAASRSTRDAHRARRAGQVRAAGPARKAAEPSAIVPRKPVTTRGSATTGPAGRPTKLTLGAECLVCDAGSLKETLAALLDEPLAITLEITALQRIDTAALQVMTAFVRERAGHGRRVEWQGTAPALTSAARLLGLTSLLGLPA